MEEIIQKIAVIAIPMIFGITLHEAAHAYAARRFGDNTAYALGRMTLNPIKHIDPIWTIVVPLVTMLATGFLFGAAKPVPINASALRNPRRDMMWVAAAGPAANLLMMIMWAIVAKVMLNLPTSGPTQYFTYVAVAGVSINALLMVFNLFPLLPLDGGRILEALLPRDMARAYSRIEPYGMIILVVLLISGGFAYVLGPLVDISVKTVYSAFGVS
jgi:Zn-dependent protease